MSIIDLENVRILSRAGFQVLVEHKMGYDPHIAYSNGLVFCMVAVLFLGYY